MIVSFYYVTIMISDYCLVGNWEQFIHSFIHSVSQCTSHPVKFYLLTMVSGHDPFFSAI